MTRTRTRALGGAAGLAVLGLVAAGCGGSDSGSGIYSVGISEPQFMIPTNCNESGCAEVLDALYMPLVTYDVETNEAQLSELTDSIESEDNKTWTIKIKDGWTFHDGTPVTADSFIKAWNYGALVTNAQNNSYFFGPDAMNVVGYADVHPDDENAEPTATTMVGLKKVSDTEFTVDLAAPFSQFKTVLGYTAFYPMPDAAFNADGTIVKGFEEAPIGNGPFEMDGTWEHNVQIKTVAYEDYQGTKAKSAGVTFKIYQSLDAQWADLQANNLDISDTLPSSALASAEAVLGERYINKASSVFQFLGFPTTDAAYADVRIRQAVSMAINRPEITKTIFESTRVPAASFVSPIVAGYRADTCGEYCTFNAAQAKQLFDAAGGVPGGVITITYNNDGGHKPWVDAACNQIAAALSVTCNGVPKADFATLLDDLDKTQTDPSATFGPFRLGWSMDYPSIQNYLGPIYTSEGSSNYYGYSNPQFDQLIVDGNQAASDEDATAKYQQAEDILSKDFPVVPLWFANTTGGYSTNVSDVTIDAYERVDKVNVVVNG